MACKTTRKHLKGFSLAKSGAFSECAKKDVRNCHPIWRIVTRRKEIGQKI